MNETMHRTDSRTVKSLMEDRYRALCGELVLQRQATLSLHSVSTCLKCEVHYAQMQVRMGLV